MIHVDPTQLAEHLNGVGLDALEEYVRATVVPAILAAMPVGDPALDPDPSTSLRDNLTVRRQGHQIVIEIDTPYAAAQHYGHYTHPRGGGARFLEDPVQQAAAVIETVIAERVRRQLAESARVT